MYETFWSPEHFFITQIAEHLCLIKVYHLYVWNILVVRAFSYNTNCWTFISDSGLSFVCMKYFGRQSIFFITQIAEHLSLI